MSLPVCVNCEHPNPHNRWGRCTVDGCGCSDLEIASWSQAQTLIPDEAESAAGDKTVLVMRDPITEAPIVIPEATALDNDRVYKAYTDHIAGKSWLAIANEPDSGWVSAQSVAATVQVYLDRGRVVYGEYTADELLAIDVARLDRLLSFVWAKAESGTVGHVNTARMLVMDRIKALGSSRERDVKSPDAGKPTTLVFVSEKDGEYTQQLRLVADNTKTQEAT